MKITASKRDDILKRKAEYDEKLKKYQERNSELTGKYRAAEDKVTNSVKRQIEDRLLGFDLLNFDISVERSWYSIAESNSVRVRIECKCGALTWTYRVEVNQEGNIEAETNSWSGLSATTPEQIEALRQTVGALTELSHIVWEDVITGLDLPDYADYRDPDNRPPVEEDFKGQLRDLTFEELIGQDKIIKVDNWDTSPYWGTYVWVKVIRQSASFWTVSILPNSYFDYLKSDPEHTKIENWLSDPVRIRKDRLDPAEPIEIREMY